MEHYYTENPQVEHDIKRIKYSFKDYSLEFITDAGVFSKDRVDVGSDLLIRALPEGLSGKALDIGCGYGAIGISIAKANPNVHVTMTDVNLRALELARINAERNGADNVEIFQSDGFSNVEGDFDIIISNPPIRAGKRVIYSIFEESINHLKAGGFFYIVIQKKQGGPSAIDKLTEIYGNCEKVEKSGGYWVLRSKKYESQ